MKNVIIASLVVSLVISLISISNMSSKASYWMDRCYSAEEVIRQVYEDKEDYVLDVLCEGDAWSNWVWFDGAGI